MIEPIIGSTEQLEGGPVFASQEAEDFSRVWTSAYEAVMRETRDHETAEEAANLAWQLFLETREELRGQASRSES